MREPMLDIDVVGRSDVQPRIACEALAPAASQQQALDGRLRALAGGLIPPLGFAGRAVFQGLGLRGGRAVGAAVVFGAGNPEKGLLAAVACRGEGPAGLAMENNEMCDTAEALGRALDRALAAVRFDLGRMDTARPEGFLSRYASRPDETLGPQGFREMHERTRREGGPRAGTHQVRMEDGSRAALVATVRKVLCDFVDPSTDSIRHTFPMGGDGGVTVTAQRDELYTHVRSSSVDQFTDSLVRGAAVAGSEPVARLVAGWAAGRPVSYRTCVVVPITIAKAVSPLAGVDVVPLALSTANLPAGLPARQGKSRADYLGQTLVSVETEMTPALFRPGTPEAETGAVRTALTPPVTLETIREALSLETDAFVERGLAWDEFGDFTALAHHGGLGRGSLGYLRHRKGQTTSMDTWVSTVELCNDDVRKLSEERVGAILQGLQQADGRTRMAVSRWKTAKDEVRLRLGHYANLKLKVRWCLRSAYETSMSAVILSLPYTSLLCGSSGFSLTEPMRFLHPTGLAKPAETPTRGRLRGTFSAGFHL